MLVCLTSKTLRRRLRRLNASLPCRFLLFLALLAGTANFFAGGMPLPRSRDWKDLMGSKPQARTEPHFPVDMFLDSASTRRKIVTTTAPTSTTPSTTPVAIPDDVEILPEHILGEKGQRLGQAEVEIIKVNASMTPTQLLKEARLTGRDKESTDFYEPIVEGFKKQGQFALFLQNALAFRRRNDRKYWGPYNPIYWGKYAAEGKEWFLNARKALAKSQNMEETDTVPEEEKTVWRLPSYRGVWMEVEGEERDQAGIEWYFHFESHLLEGCGSDCRQTDGSQGTQGRVLQSILPSETL